MVRSARWLHSSTAALRLSVAESWVIASEYDWFKNISLKMFKAIFISGSLWISICVKSQTG